jgi:hypothetical protein
VSNNIEKIRKGDKFRTYRNMEFQRKEHKIYKEMEVELSTKDVSRETFMAQTR